MSGRPDTGLHERVAHQTAMLAAARGDLVCAGTTGELDQVLVELEPDAVVAVDAGRRDEALVARQRLIERATEPDAVVR